MTTQTTGGFSFGAADVDVSADGENWTVLDGHGTSIAVDTGARSTGEDNTFEGETPILGAGKLASTSLTVRFIYTEAADEPFEVCRAIFETEKGPCWVRYWPGGRANGQFIFETGLGIMTTLMYPQGEASAAETIKSEFSMQCVGISKDVSAGGS